jgi:hypothetical protein
MGVTGADEEDPGCGQSTHPARLAGEEAVGCEKFPASCCGQFPASLLEWWAADADQGVDGLWVWLADESSCYGG